MEEALWTGCYSSLFTMFRWNLMFLLISTVSQGVSNHPVGYFRNSCSSQSSKLIEFFLLLCILQLKIRRSPQPTPCITTSLLVEKDNSCLLCLSWKWNDIRCGFKCTFPWCLIHQRLLLHCGPKIHGAFAATAAVALPQTMLLISCGTVAVFRLSHFSNLNYQYFQIWFTFFCLIRSSCPFIELSQERKLFHL